MPSRVVRHEINLSRSLSSVSMEADLTFRALIVAVDDYGRMEADPLLLKAALFPRRETVTPKRVRGWVDELAREGCVAVYRVSGCEYLQMTGWERHRGRTNRSKASKYPPPEDAEQNPQDAFGPSTSPPGDSRRFPEIPASYGFREGVGEGEGVGASEAEPSDGARFASDFEKALKEAHPGFKPPTDSARRAWEREARLMLGERSDAEARELMTWMFTAACKESAFWRGVVLSVPKFREKFDAIAAQKRRASKQSASGVLGIDRGPTREEIVAAMAKGIR